MQTQQRTTAQFPRKLDFLFRPARYKVAYGGRGSSKSWSVARALLIIGASRPIRVLCAREIQNSIEESVHKLLSEQIVELGFAGRYKITQRSITGLNGTEFIFSGLRSNITKVKSMEGIDIAWAEEAEKVSKNSWQVLIPTIRKPGSEIWVTFNPDEETDPTYQRFIVNTPPEAVTRLVNWRDNPWFPDELRREMEYLKAVDYDAYLHVWEGLCRKRSDAQILNGKWVVEWFEPQPSWDGPYYGADWGFANDPTTAIRMWINATDPRGPELMIEHEAWGLRVDIDKTPELFDQIPEARQHTIRADCARPETISYMQNHGYPAVTGCAKWSGSVEDGITFLRSFRRIVIHTRCAHTAQEARLYSYKIDRLTGDVLAEVVDAHNHCWDAVRYGLEPLIRGSGLGMLHFLQGEVQQQATDEDKFRSMVGG